MEKKKRPKGICVIKCEAGNESFPDMTKTDCKERARVSVVVLHGRAMRRPGFPAYPINLSGERPRDLSLST